MKKSLLIGIISYLNALKVQKITKSNIEDHVRANSTNVFAFIDENCVECPFVVEQMNKAHEMIPSNSLGVTLGIIDSTAEPELALVFDTAINPSIVRLSDGTVSTFYDVVEPSRILNFAMDWACNSKSNHLSNLECRSILPRFIESDVPISNLDIPVLKRSSSSSSSSNKFPSLFINQLPLDSHEEIVIYTRAELLPVLLGAPTGFSKDDSMKIVESKSCTPSQRHKIEEYLPSFCELLGVYGMFSHTEGDEEVNLVIPMVSMIKTFPSSIENPSLELLSIGGLGKYLNHILLTVLKSDEADASPPANFKSMLAEAAISLGPLSASLLVNCPSNVCDRFDELFNLRISSPPTDKKGMNTMQMFVLSDLMTKPKAFRVPPPSRPPFSADDIFSHISSSKILLTSNHAEPLTSLPTILELDPYTMDVFLRPPGTKVGDTKKSLLVFFKHFDPHSKRVLQWLPSSAGRLAITQPELSIGLIDMDRYKQDMDSISDIVPGPLPNFGTPIIRYISLRKTENNWVVEKAEDYYGERFSHVLEAWLAQPEMMGSPKNHIEID